jgi:SulP family sulfate permease
MKNPKSDITVLWLTFILTVIFDLTIAIEVGLILACLLCMRRMAETTQVKVLTDQDDIDPNAETDINNPNIEHITIPEHVEVYEINGPYFFGMASKFEDIMNRMRERPRVRIIRMRRVPFIDSTGMHNLQNLIEMSHQSGITVILSGVNEKVHKVLQRNGFVRLLGEQNICSNINDALHEAEKLNH